MMHRLREAMRVGDLCAYGRRGGKTVEVDETFIGRKEGVKKGRRWLGAQERRPNL